MCSMVWWWSISVRRTRLYSSATWVAKAWHLFATTIGSSYTPRDQRRVGSARNSMLNQGLDAASAAFEVGNESATQFNREYSRFFGPIAGGGSRVPEVYAMQL